MTKLGQLLTSSSFWTAFVAILIQVFPQIKGSIPAPYVDTISLVLGILAGYLHINTVDTAVAASKVGAPVKY